MSLQSFQAAIKSENDGTLISIKGAVHARTSLESTFLDGSCGSKILMNATQCSMWGHHLQESSVFTIRSRTLELLCLH